MLLKRNVCVLRKPLDLAKYNSPVEPLLSGPWERPKCWSLLDPRSSWALIWAKYGSLVLYSPFSTLKCARCPNVATIKMSRFRWFSSLFSILSDARAGLAWLLEVKTFWSKIKVLMWSDQCTKKSRFRLWSFDLSLIELTSRRPHNLRPAFKDTSHHDEKFSNRPYLIYLFPLPICLGSYLKQTCAYLFGFRSGSVMKNTIGDGGSTAL